MYVCMLYVSYRCKFKTQGVFQVHLAKCNKFAHNIREKGHAHIFTDAIFFEENFNHFAEMRKYIREKGHAQIFTDAIFLEENYNQFAEMR